MVLLAAVVVAALGASVDAVCDGVVAEESGAGVSARC
jgi:hypothetical protein